MKVAVIGTGYVGLVAGACFSDTGNTVVCVDKDSKKIKTLRSGGIPIYEPGLEALVQRGIRTERLSFTNSIQEALLDVQVVFIAVGTPANQDGSPDLSYVEIAAKEIGQNLSGYAIIVNKSTVPIGTFEKVTQWIRSQTQQKFDVVSNPEFLREGSAVDDFLKPDRVVIGTDEEAVFQKMSDLYMPFVRQGNPILHMDPTSAEITKYACNSFLATRISFMNELSNLCEAVGGDVEKVRQGMITDFRIGKHFLYAGVGYGGSCFPKDVQALASIGKEKGISLRIINAAEEANYAQKKILAEKVQKVFGKDLSGKQFAVWGLAFKPNTDDMREAPSVEIIRALVKNGANIKAYDPVSIDRAKEIMGVEIEYSKTAYEAAKDVNAILLVTEWNEFRHLDLNKLGDVMKEKVIFDGRNILSEKHIKEAGFQYYGMGRATV